MQVESLEKVSLLVNESLYICLHTMENIYMLNLPLQKYYSYTNIDMFLVNWALGTLSRKHRRIGSAHYKNA